MKLLPKAQNDRRFPEADQFLQLKESLSEVWAKYEEKQKILASKECG
jgi:hypothetical protein